MALTNKLITKNEISIFLGLFNRNGYVLDFSTASFDKFTFDSVGEKLCSMYNLSKGKSLEWYCNDTKETDVIKLLNDLLNYYECKYSSGITGENRKEYDEYSGYYKKCKQIIERILSPNEKIPTFAKSIEEKFSSKYMSEQIELMLKMKNTNPTEAIGKAKELLESCCKSILDEGNQKYETSIDISKLIKKTMQFLKVDTQSISDMHSEANIIKKILSSLNSLASGLAELRNAYGSGHGKNFKFIGLEPRHADLAIGSSITLVNYLWSTFEWRKAKGKL